MKKTLILLLTITLILSLTVSCANSKDTDNDKNDGTSTNDSNVNLTIGEDALSFSQNNIKITPNSEAKPIIEALGEPLEYSESASCGFEDMDKTYKYNGFVIDTVTTGGVEYIYIVQIINDMVSTPEGATIGMSLEEIQTAYNGKYEMRDGHLTVSFTNGLMTCFIKNGVCTNITYESTTIPNLEKND